MSNLFQLFVGDYGQLVESSAYIMIVSGAIVFFILLYIPAPYGRYSRAELPCYGHPSLTWFLQESPAFFIPAVGLWCSGRWSVLNANAVLLGYFLLHYFHR